MASADENKRPEATTGGFEGTKAGEPRELVPGIVFHWCPPGSFVMGSPNTEADRRDGEDQMNVTLTSGFWMCETEVTQGQWRKLMGTSPWSERPNWIPQSIRVNLPVLAKEGEDHPATHVCHDDAASYCERLTSHERNADRLPKGWKYSLPTEAQWEYACRAGSKTSYCFGDDELQLDQFAWFYKNAYEIGEKYAHGVGQKRANPWGLKDTHGNVWEWCSDWSGDKLLGGVDPQGPSSGSVRVCRGGSWINYASDCRSAFRGGDSPDDRIGSLGFRVAAVR